VTTQLTIYNGALLVAGERFLSSLTEQVEPRRLLDHIWSNGGIEFCLEQGQWHFAMCTVQLDYDSSVEPPFGYNRAFTKPTDWILTSAVCSDPFFRTPLTRYSDEAGYWYSDLDTIYVRYVSNDTAYGMDLNKWPETFREYVEAYFASRILLKLSDSEEKVTKAEKLTAKRLATAKSKAAMAEPTAFPAQGGWTSARRRFSNRRDGGGTGSLIG
jgi:hypothetical protein